MSFVINADPLPIADTYFTASSLNKMDGRTAFTLHINGRRKGWVNTTDLQDIVESNSGTIITAPEPAGVALEVVSSSANDTVAGTGVRKIYFTYLDVSGNMVRSAAVNMNGVTPVALGTVAHYIQGMGTWDVGSGLVAAGNIIIREVATPATIHEQITAGTNSSASARFKVPTGYTAYCSNWDGHAINNDQDLRLRSTALKLDRTLGNAPTAFPVFHLESTQYLPINTSSTEDLPWLKFPEGCRIKISSIPAATGATVRADVSFSLLLVSNT